MYYKVCAECLRSYMSTYVGHCEKCGCNKFLIPETDEAGTKSASSNGLASRGGLGKGGTLFSSGESTFEKELCHLINRFSRENGSDTPDYVLAEYMNDCLNAYEKAIRAREKDMRVVAENKVG